METLLQLALFGSFTWFVIFTAALFVILLVSDLEENGYVATLFITLFLICNYFWGNLPLLKLITRETVIAYVLIGFIFSIIRTYFKGKELSVREKKDFQLKEHVFRWWFLFPIAAINWIFGRLLKDLWNSVYNKVGSMYLYIFNQ